MPGVNGAWGFGNNGQQSRDNFEFCFLWLSDQRLDSCCSPTGMGSNSTNTILPDLTFELLDFNFLDLPSIFLEKKRCCQSGSLFCSSTWLGIHSNLQLSNWFVNQGCRWKPQAVKQRAEWCSWSCACNPEVNGSKTAFAKCTWCLQCFQQYPHLNVLGRIGTHCHCV